MPGFYPGMAQALMGQQPQPFQGGGASGSWAPQPTFQERWNQTATKAMIDALIGAAKLPGDVYAGRTEVYPGMTSPETIERAADFGGFAMTGGIGVPASELELAAGLRGLPAGVHESTISPSVTSTARRTVNSDEVYVPTGLASMKAAGPVSSATAKARNLSPDTTIYQHNMDLMRNPEAYPGIRGALLGPDAVATEATKVSDSNLQFLLSKATPEDMAGRNWYVGANQFAQDIAQRTGVELPAASGLVAALSPQARWEFNAYFADQLANMYRNHRGLTLTPEMQRWAEQKIAEEATITPALQSLLSQPGRTFDSYLGALYDNPRERDAAMFGRLFEEAHGDYANPGVHAARSFNPNGTFGDYLVNAGDGNLTKPTWNSTTMGSNALRALMSGGDQQMISDAMGGVHKVRSFYNNILDPTNPLDVTMDTHAIGAQWLAPLGGNDQAVLHGLATGGRPSMLDSSAQGSFGNYGLNADAYRKTAVASGLLPREVQSITWGQKKNLFDNLTAAEDAQIRAEWMKYNQRKQSLAKTQEEIYAIGSRANARASNAR